MPILSTNNQLEPTYVRREIEEVVAQNLLYGGHRTILLFGTAGIGKTTLAMAVAKRLYSHFPAGVWNVNSNPRESLSENVLNLLPHTSQESLLIINDIEPISDPDMGNELQCILNFRPQSKIILTSRRPVRNPFIGASFKLSGFSHAEMQEFFYKQFEDTLEKWVIEKLFQQLQGNPLLARVVSDALKADLFTPEDLIKSIEPFRREGLLGPDGLPLHPDSKSYDSIVSDTTAINDELLRKIASDPKLLYEVSPRLFEEIVADLLRRLGYKITLTPASRDGGKDIYAAKRDELGSFLYVVECKKYSPDNPVGVSLVRQLYGVVQAEKATAGILATTSFFTKGAKEFQTQVAYQISLQDYLGIQKWLKSI